MALAFEKGTSKHIVIIKSRPHWSKKSQQQKRLLDAKKTMATRGLTISVMAVNGCCYGKDGKPHKSPKNGGDDDTYCGQACWDFIAGNSVLYKDIIEPLGQKAKEKNALFFVSYPQSVNGFTIDFFKSILVKKMKPCIGA